MLRKIVSLSCMLVMLVSMMTPAAVYAKQTEMTLNDAQISLINASLEDESKDLPIDEQFRINVESRDISVVEGLDENWLNILLLGTDTADIRLNFGRTDTMLVLSLNTLTGQMKLTSLLRDMLVEIPGYKINNRISTANAFGGPLLAMKTVNEILGLNIERYCSINFNGFKDIVDYLGGVSLVLSGDDAVSINARHTSEPQVLSGEQALAYVRIRYPNNSFSRNERQRKFLTSVLAQVKQGSADQIIAAIAAGFKSIATNLTTAEVISLLPALIRSADILDTLSLPQEGAYKLSTASMVSGVIEFDIVAARNTFHAFVYGYGP
jgi:LCP family protein required for cell wall assembly